MVAKMVLLEGQTGLHQFTGVLEELDWGRERHSAGGGGGGGGLQEPSHEIEVLELEQAR